MAEVEKRHPVKFDTPDSIIKEIEDENKKKQLVVKYRGKSIVTRDFVRDFDHGYINVNNQKIPTSWDIAISRGPARGILFIGKDQFEMNGDSVKAVGRLSGQLGTEEEAIKLAKTVFAQQVKTACIAMKGAATPTVPFAAFAASNGFGRMAQGAFGITDLVDPDARPESKGPSRFSFALLVLESKGKLYARGRWNFPGAGGYVYDRVPETPLEKTRDEKWQLPSTYSLSGFNRIPEKQKALRERLEDYLNKKLIPEMNKAQPLQAPTEITRQPKKLSFEQMKGVVPTRMHLAGAKRQNWPQQKRG